MNLPFGLIVESFVALLLVTTIGYCVVLNDKLKKLHADRDALKLMVADLVQATNMANGAMASLRTVANETDATLQGRLEEADRFAVELANHVTAGRAVMDRIAKITEAAEGRSVAIAPTPMRTSGAADALEQLASMQRRRENAA